MGRSKQASIQHQEWEAAGRDYAHDWLCWHTDEISKLTDEQEKVFKRHALNEMQGCAFDLAAGVVEDGHDQEAAADWIYEGMSGAIEEAFGPKESR